MEMAAWGPPTQPSRDFVFSLSVRAFPRPDSRKESVGCHPTHLTGQCRRPIEPGKTHHEASRSYAALKDPCTCG